MPNSESYRFALRVVRNLLRSVNYRITGAYGPRLLDEPFDAARRRQAEEALRQLHAEDPGAKAYLETHIPRLARTLALVPPPQTTGRVLELGCYMQITPFLERLCGYREVYGGYFGTLGRVDTKRVQFPDGEFVCQVAHFDAERDRFPYPDANFDLVIAGEIVEHFVSDPMHALLEARRVLIEGGYLLVSTPNVASISSVGKLLDGHNNPQIYAAYTRPENGVASEVGHVREYTFHELEVLVRSAGFEPQQSFTTFLPEYALHLPYLSILEENGFDPKNRGEQSWCLAVKRAALPVDRYPFFLYTS
jgi:SAM-dependent methyltransferase